MSTQERVFIDRFYRTKHTKTYNFHVPTLVKSTSHKITAKSVIFCPNSLLLTKKQLYAIHFFLATCNVCPLAIPESFTHNMDIRLLVNHSFSSIKYSHICPGYYLLQCRLFIDIEYSNRAFIIFPNILLPAFKRVNRKKG